jgi:predicted enzyme related to lactoylglutathione lyase
MSTRDDYPAGAPCWVDTFQPDLDAAARFYAQLFGWDLSESDPLPGGRYLTARLRGSVVAGIGQAPDTLATAVWSTYIRVDDIEAAIERAAQAGGGLLMGPLTTGPAGRLAVLTDASGVAFCVWRAGDRNGAELVNEPGTWAMSALHTPSGEQSESFYGAVFGWQLELLPGTPLGLWRLPGYVGGTPQQPMPRDVVAVMSPIADGSDVPPHWAVNLCVDDADATAEAALALGATIVLPPMDTPWSRSAVIADPQGGVIAVSTARAQ